MMAKHSGSFCNYTLTNEDTNQNWAERKKSVKDAISPYKTILN